MYKQAKKMLINFFLVQAEYSSVIYLKGLNKN